MPTSASLINIVFAAIALYLIAWSLYLGGRALIGTVVYAFCCVLTSLIVIALWLMPTASIGWFTPLTIVIVTVMLFPLDDAGVSADDDESPSYTE